MKTIVAVYDTVNDAYQAIEALRDAGVDRSNISLVTGDPEREYAPYFQGEAHDDRDDPVEGALAGGTIGGIAGLLLGLGALAIPGLGPVVAAGPLVSGLVGAGIGAAGGGLLGALVEAGIPEEDAGHYLEGVRRGGTLVAVRVMGYQAGDVVDILESNQPIDLEERVESWRRSGWTGFNAEEDQQGTWEQFKEGVQVGWEEVSTPAYRFGHLLAEDMRYQDRPWDEIELVARERWERDHAGDRPWPEVKESIRRAWEEAQ